MLACLDSRRSWLGPPLTTNPRRCRQPRANGHHHHGNGTTPAPRRRQCSRCSQTQEPQKEDECSVGLRLSSCPLHLHRQPHPNHACRRPSRLHPHGRVDRLQAPFLNNKAPLIHFPSPRPRHLTARGLCRPPQPQRPLPSRHRCGPRVRQDAPPLSTSSNSAGLFSARLPPLPPACPPRLRSPPQPANACPPPSPPSSCTSRLNLSSLPRPSPLPR